ncbi:MAG: TraY domain-containing protein [Spirochaetaceae bacterium]|jgi:RHH-type rel operon transcriptional repressor/antitoxin RelB|nr:TraY domain-containing protein [Spirochaetaceae bacterium]
MIAVRMSADIEERLARLAKETGRTKTYYVREALELHLDDIEDAYLAEKTLEEIRMGKQGTVSLDSLIEEYGLED